LEPEYRQKLLLSDLKELDADIICLQEVDNEVFESLKKSLDELYAGVRAQRPNEWADGLATFYKKAKFE
jgi:mRNA deadenylase 3'-5' endonuclease subunit Ccr4